MSIMQCLLPDTLNDSKELNASISTPRRTVYFLSHSADQQEHPIGHLCCFCSASFHSISQIRPILGPRFRCLSSLLLVTSALHISGSHVRLALPAKCALSLASLPYFQLLPDHTVSRCRRSIVRFSCYARSHRESERRKAITSLGHC
jgi:hypothetical protein